MGNYDMYLSTFIALSLTPRAGSCYSKSAMKCVIGSIFDAVPK